MVKQRSHPPRGRHGNVKLVLIEDVQFLGKQGDLVEVRPGYARNYLLPRGYGMVPTEHNIRLLDRYKIKVKQAHEARLADLKALGEQISKMAGITIEANVNPDGHLYGSVGAAEIAKALRAKNLPVDPEMIRLEALEGGNIKETGLFEVPLNLGFEIETKVKVLVIAQQK